MNLSKDLTDNNNTSNDSPLSKVIKNMELKDSDDESEKVITKIERVASLP